ncbi:hypothetical protein MB14_01965 [Roseivirga ehrenbergii]|uniref:Uncharacterized protein n=1 Tax=Roseivirga ehrenbergii (strain DSM 102268 / JCM 13514 / KCTC 12282 / NCIMB 14502 / KMM 6017) TaxID=279360 RepID=A0A150XU83_ROSEK|nr:hypothetical protein MB14_01965 [Roseivirga ehrenbergii]
MKEASSVMPFFMPINDRTKRKGTAVRNTLRDSTKIRLLYEVLIPTSNSKLSFLASSINTQFRVFLLFSIKNGETIGLSIIIIEVYLVTLIT